MTDNTMQTLRCRTEGHGPMERRLADRQPYAGPFSVWVCVICGTLALTLEWCGDIYWFGATKTTWHSREGHRRFMEELISQPSHQATCEFHTTEHVFMCPCGNPDGPHMCDSCDVAAEESKMPEGSTKRTDCKCFPDSGCEHQADAGERADEAR